MGHWAKAKCMNERGTGRGSPQQQIGQFRGLYRMRYGNWCLATLPDRSKNSRNSHGEDVGRAAMWQRASYFVATALRKYIHRWPSRWSRFPDLISNFATLWIIWISGLIKTWTSMKLLFFLIRKISKIQCSKPTGAVAPNAPRKSIMAPKKRRLLWV